MWWLIIEPFMDKCEYYLMKNYATMGCEVPAAAVMKNSVFRDIMP
jgi:hypothetical protein